MNNKDKYLEVYQIAEDLSRSTFLLRKKSRGLYVWQIFTAVFPLGVYLTLLLLLSNSAPEKIDPYRMIPMMVCYVAFFCCFFICMRAYYRLGMLLNEVKEKCSELSDMVDWTTMRKKQIYNALDPKIQKSIDDFFDYSKSNLCPFYGGKTKYKLLRMLSLIEIIIVMTISLLITFGVIK